MCYMICFHRVCSRAVQYERHFDENDFYARYADLETLQRAVEIDELDSYLEEEEDDFEDEE